MRRSWRSTGNVWRGRSFHGSGSRHSTPYTQNDESSQTSRGRGRHPPGLKGREIGLWYAKQHATKRGPKNNQFMELQLTLDSKKVSEVRSYLKNMGSMCASFNLDCELTPACKRGIKTWEDGEFNIDQRALDNELKNFTIEKNPVIDERLHESYKNKLLDDKYNQMQKYREKLPSFEKRKDILDAIEHNQVVVISGETGCGKTTQVPQYILDSFIQEKKASQCNIICTQPRRISAITIAERVAEERAEACGKESVGYHIRLENKLPSGRGSIIYCTTGIVLKYLQNDPQLLRASHVILDEIHERDLLADFLMIILKDLLAIRPDLKLIVMSATLNAKQFSKYFGNCPMLSISGFTYPVQEYYLEDVLEMTKYTPPDKGNDYRNRNRNRGRNINEKQQEYENSKDTFLRTLNERYHPSTINSLRHMDEEEFNYDLIKELIKNIDQSKPPGAILVFLPGWDQISKLNTMLTNDFSFQTNKQLIIPLHSMMPTLNQKVVFERPPRGVRKIILATNIAETSITIDDVVYVVNAGKIKISNFDSNKVLSTLTPEWVSLANAHQRRGRAGRVQPGICYHLYTKLRENFLDSYQLPEILRTRLEELCLQIKILKLGKIQPFVQKALDSPSLQALEVAIGLLTKLNALDSEENLTHLGYLLAQLPLDPQTGKMLLLGAIFGCVDPVLTVAASLNFKDAFILPLGKEKQADEQKRVLAEGCKSDHLLQIKAFEGWKNSSQRGHEYLYCRDYFLSSSTLRMLDKMKDQLAHHLFNMKFIATPNIKDRKANVNSGNDELIRAIVFGGLYPNIAKLTIKPGSFQKRKRPPKVRTSNDGSVSLHPKSVNAFESSYESCWLTYYTKVKSTKVFLHDVSMVSALSMVLFSSKAKIENSESLIVDDYCALVCNKETAEIVLELKRHLHDTLNVKYIQPSVTNWDDRNSILNKIVSLISDEEMILVPVQSKNADLDDDEEEAKDGD